MEDLDAIYVAARELSPDDRPAYLAEACGSNRGLRSRIEQMLLVADAAEAFITDVPDADTGPRTRGKSSRTSKLRGRRSP